MDVDASRGLLRYLAQVPDPRARNISHRLYNLLVISLLAVLCRCEDYVEIADWAQANEPWLATFLDLAHGTPSHDTFDRVFARLDPMALERCFLAFTQAVQESSEGRLLAVDGKSIRRSFEAGGRKAAVHMISAWDHHNGLILGQLACEDGGKKSNEITAIPRLLKLLDIRGCIVSIDAIGCQKQIAEQVIDQGGDYLLAVKDNQPTLHENLKLYFDEAIEHAFEGVEHVHAQSVDGDHGRLETRRVWATHQVDWLTRQLAGDPWPQLRGIVCVERQRHVFGTDKTTVERHYRITSVDPRDVGGDWLLEAVRKHWGIENSVHWSLDVTYREDHSRVRKDHGPENISRLRRMSLNMVKRLPDRLSPHTGRPRKTSLKRRRLWCDWDRDYLLAALTTV